MVYLVNDSLTDKVILQSTGRYDTGSVRGKGRPRNTPEPRVTKSGHEPFFVEEIPYTKEPGNLYCS